MGKDRKTYSTSTQSQTQAGSQLGGYTGSNYGGYANTQGLDPLSQAFVNWQRGLAQGGAGAALGTPGTPGPTPEMLAILGQMGGGGANTAGMYANLLGSANQLLGGNALKAQTMELMSPFTAAVVDPTRQEYDRLRALGKQEIGDAAIKAGAFGGTRHGVAEGVRGAELDRAQAKDIATLLGSGYDKALQAALQLQNQTGSALGGLGAGIGAQSELDFRRQQQLFENYDYLRRIAEQQGLDPVARYQHALQFSNMGLGPTGWTTSGSQYGGQSGTQNTSYTGGSSGTSRNTQVQPGNVWNDILGAALTFGPMLFGAPPMPGAASYMRGPSPAYMVSSAPTGTFSSTGTSFGQPLVRSIF